MCQNVTLQDKQIIWRILYTCIPAGQGEGSINQQLMSSGIDVLIHHLHPVSHKYSLQK